jgi:acetyltransferase
MLPLIAPPRLAEPCGPALDTGRMLLADGRPVSLRPVQPTDFEAERRFVEEALSPATRRLRFHGALNRLPPSVLRAMTAVNPCVQTVLVAAHGSRIVADARYVIEAGDARAAEFAIAVADAWQGLGLGRALMQRLAEHARARGLARLHGEVLDHNRRMLGLMASLGARLRPQTGGLGLVGVEVPLEYI